MNGLFDDAMNRAENNTKLKMRPKQPPVPKLPPIAKSANISIPGGHRPPLPAQKVPLGQQKNPTVAAADGRRRAAAVRTSMVVDHDAALGSAARALPKPKARGAEEIAKAAAKTANAEAEAKEAVKRAKAQALEAEAARAQKNGNTRALAQAEPVEMATPAERTLVTELEMGATAGVPTQAQAEPEHTVETAEQQAEGGTAEPVPAETASPKATAQMEEDGYDVEQEDEDFEADSEAEPELA